MNSNLFNNNIVTSDIISNQKTTDILISEKYGTIAALRRGYTKAENIITTENYFIVFKEVYKQNDNEYTFLKEISLKDFFAKIMKKSIISNTSLNLNLNSCATRLYTYLNNIYVIDNVIYKFNKSMLNISENEDSKKSFRQLYFNKKDISDIKLITSKLNKNDPIQISVTINLETKDKSAFILLIKNKRTEITCDNFRIHTLHILNKILDNEKNKRKLISYTAFNDTDNKNGIRKLSISKIYKYNLLTSTLLTSTVQKKLIINLKTGKTYMYTKLLSGTKSIVDFIDKSCYEDPFNFAFNKNNCSNFGIRDVSYCCDNSFFNFVFDKVLIASQKGKEIKTIITNIYNVFLEDIIKYQKDNFIYIPKDFLYKDNKDNKDNKRIEIDIEDVAKREVAATAISSDVCHNVMENIPLINKIRIDAYTDIVCKVTKTFKPEVSRLLTLICKVNNTFSLDITRLPKIFRKNLISLLDREEMEKSIKVLVSLGLSKHLNFLSADNFNKFYNLFILNEEVGLLKLLLHSNDFFDNSSYLLNKTSVKTDVVKINNIINNISSFIKRYKIKYKKIYNETTLVNSIISSIKKCDEYNSLMTLNDTFLMFNEHFRKLDFILNINDDNSHDKLVYFQTELNSNYTNETISYKEKERSLEFFKDLSFSLAKDTKDLKITGEVMRICVGATSYCTKAIKHNSFIVLGKKDSIPCICIELTPSENGYILEQFKFKANLNIFSMLCRNKKDLKFSSLKESLKEKILNGIFYLEYLVSTNNVSKPSLDNCCDLRLLDVLYLLEEEKNKYENSPLYDDRINQMISIINNLNSK